MKTFRIGAGVEVDVFWDTGSTDHVLKSVEFRKDTAYIYMAGSDFLDMVKALVKSLKEVKEASNG